MASAPEYGDLASMAINPMIFEDLPPPSDVSKRGRITLYCTAESFDRKLLEQMLRSTLPASAIKSYPDVFYVEYFTSNDDTPGGDVFFFDYGVVACWGLSKQQEAAVIRTYAKGASVNLVATADVEIDQVSSSMHMHALLCTACCSGVVSLTWVP